MSKVSLRDRLINAVVEEAGGDGGELFLDARPVPGYVSSQSLEVDELLGKPGLPLGRVTQIKGWSGSCKSMVCMHVLGEVQKMGGLGVLMDTERSYDRAWAESLGVNPDEIFDIVKELNVTSLESALRAIDILLDTIEVDDEEPVVIIVDSLSALPTEAELESDYDDKQPAIHAKTLSKAMRKLTIKVFEKKVALIFVSQLRDNIMQFGASTSVLGGHAIFFHAALELEMKRVAVIKEGNKPVGVETRIKVTKNKLGGIPYTERVVKFYFDRGIDTAMSALNLAIEYGMVEYHKGGWHTLVGEPGKKFREAQWPEKMTDDMLAQIKRIAFPTMQVDVPVSE